MLEENFNNLFKDKVLYPKIYPGALIKGTVINISNKFVIVSAFLKADGYIPISQFKNDDGDLEVAVGDEIEVVIDYLEDVCGDMRLSREKAKRIRAWQELEKIHKANDIIVGFITAKVKGGFTVKINNIKAFLPGSLVYQKPIIDADELKGKELKFKIIKLEKKKNNIVVSQRFISEEKNNKSLKDLLDKINEGDVVEGLVKNITDYGVFIDLGGIDGLLHITDMSWKRVKHPSNVVKMGDSIKVKILKFNKENNRVSLGLKQLTDDPWKNVKDRYKEGFHLDGKVTNITDYGCFVEIEDGIEGLVHLSEMDWTNKNVNPNKIVKQGMEVKVSILEINEEKRRISLGLKQCTENPWKSFEKIHKVGDKISGKVKSITDFGIFLGLDGGIDGLIHLSDLSWDSSEDILRDYKKGEEIEVVILSIDIERERISLGAKQLLNDPFLEYIKTNQKGSIVDCNFVKKTDKGIVVKLSDGLEGFIKVSETDINKQSKTKNVLDDKTVNFKAKIISVDKKNRNIILTLKIKSLQENKDTLNKHESKNDSIFKPTLGDLLRKQI